MTLSPCCQLGPLLAVTTRFHVEELDLGNFKLGSHLQVRGTGRNLAFTIVGEHVVLAPLARASFNG